jgi:hypothetical protein
VRVLVRSPNSASQPLPARAKPQGRMQLRATAPCAVTQRGERVRAAMPHALRAAIAPRRVVGLGKEGGGL